jgi:hypothetical protein
MESKTDIKKVIKENYLLKKRIEELTRENNRLKSANELYSIRIGANQHGKSVR